MRRKTKSDLFLFILESIGTSELILVGIIALVIFGPRKLPELAKKAGKMLNELRQVSNDFKSTWLNEVQMDEDEKNAFNFNEDTVSQNSIAPPVSTDSSSSSDSTDQVEKHPAGLPEIKTVEDSEQLEQLKSAADRNSGSEDSGDTNNSDTRNPLDNGETEKRNWL